MGVNEQTARDWMQVRKDKKASNTETAFRSIKNEIMRSGMPAEDCIRMAAESSWAGFKAEWAMNRMQPKAVPQEKKSNLQRINDMMAQVMGGLADEQ